MRIFLDANILFSGAMPRSRMAILVEAIQSNAQCLTNNYAIEEARRNLAAKFPDGLPKLDELTARCEIVLILPARLEFGVELAEKDAPILGGAIAGRAARLLTGDQRDFGRLWGKTIDGVKIVSPKMLAEELGLL